MVSTGVVIRGLHLLVGSSPGRSVFTFATGAREAFVTLRPLGLLMVIPRAPCCTGSCREQRPVVGMAGC